MFIHGRYGPFIRNCLLRTLPVYWASRHLSQSLNWWSYHLSLSDSRSCLQVIGNHSSYRAPSLSSQHSVWSRGHSIGGWSRCHAAFALSLFRFSEGVSVFLHQLAEADRRLASGTYCYFQRTVAFESLSHWEAALLEVIGRFLWKDRCAVGASCS